MALKKLLSKLEKGSQLQGAAMQEAFPSHFQLIMEDLILVIQLLFLMEIILSRNRLHLGKKVDVFMINQDKVLVENLL
jgi:hypothetical protein